MRLCLALALAGLAFAQTRDALFERGRQAQVSGRLAEAESIYRQYLKQYGTRAEVLANLGALLARREAYAEAIGYYRQALKANPSLAPLHLNLGLAYFKQGQFAQAVPQFDEILQHDPQNRQAAQLRAISLLESEQYDAAEAQFRALLPGDPSITLGLATTLVRRQKVAEARALLDPLLEKGDNPELQLVLGQALIEDGRPEEALAAFERARQLNPSLPQLRLNLGAAFWRLRKTAEAVAEWRAEYRTNPNSFASAYTLGAALALDPAQQSEAEQLLRKAVALRPHNPRAAYQLAKLIWQRSKNKEAAELLDRASTADPNFREAFILLGSVRQALGQPALAQKAFARARALSEQELSRQRDLFSESQ